MVSPIRFCLTVIMTMWMVGATAQTWAPVGATWHYSSLVGFIPASYDFHFFEVVGDTIVMGNNCRLFNSGDIMYSDSGKVFHYNDSLAAFYTLYNFDADTGDSWVVYTHPDWSGPIHDSFIVTVDSIRMVSINSVSRRELFINKTFPNGGGWDWGWSIIEGIGSTFNMFPTIGVLDPCWCGQLRCYEDTAIGLYSSGVAPACDAVYTAIEEYNNTSVITISPNPFSSETQIDIHQPNGKVLNIELHAISGQALALPYSLSSITVGNDLEPGIYVITVLTERGRYNSRLVKTR